MDVAEVAASNLLSMGDRDAAPNLVEGAAAPNLGWETDVAEFAAPNLLSMVEEDAAPNLVEADAAPNFG